MNTRNHLGALILSLGLGGCGLVGGPGGGDPDLGKAGDMATGDGGGEMEARFSALYMGYLQECRHCHTPNGPGRTSDTETTLNFTSVATAYTTITTGRAMGLKGNFMGCNGVAFVKAGSPSDSLLVAALDEGVRMSFRSGQCDKDSISDMTVKAGAPPAAFLTALKRWIQDGAKNN